MFEKAVRQKVRFQTTSGVLSVEDLWDLPLVSTTKVSLDSIAKGLNRELKEAEEVSFVAAPTAKNALIQLKFDLVKHIIQVRLDENAAKAKATEIREKKTQLQEILARKENQALENMSVDEIKAQLAAM